MESRSEIKSEEVKEELPVYPKENALLNQVVLTKLLQHVPVEDLANFRQVCSSWYATSIGKWRSNKVLNVENINWKMKMPEVVEEVIWPWECEEPPNPSSSMEAEKLDEESPEILKLIPEPDKEDKTLFKFRDCPYRRYKIVGGHSTSVEGGFWDTCGAWMYELHISSSDLISEACWEKIIFEKTPNLRKLILDGDLPSSMKAQGPSSEVEPNLPVASRRQENLKILEIRNQNWLRTFPIWWIEFFSFFTKLEDITFPLEYFDTTWVRDNSFRRFVQAVQKVKQMNPDNLPIRSLSFFISGSMQLHFRTSVSDFNLLGELGLRLKCLKIDIGLMFMNGPDISPIINHFAKAIEELTVRKMNLRDSQYPMFTQKLGSLHSLHLVGTVVPNLSFLRYTPNLNKLWIMPDAKKGWSEVVNTEIRSGIQIVDEAEEANIGVQLLNLKELHAYFMLKESSSVKLLTDWMPNLEVLKVPIGSRALSGICDGWGETLREITLTRETVDANKTTVGPILSRPGPPNVKLLKNLEYFCMEEDPRSNPDLPRVTDFAVLSGFLGLEKLKTLKIPVPRETGKQVLDALKKKGVRVITSGHNQSAITYHYLQKY